MKPVGKKVQPWFNITTEFLSTRYSLREKKSRFHSSLSVRLPFTFDKKKIYLTLLFFVNYQSPLTVLKCIHLKNICSPPMHNTQGWEVPLSLTWKTRQRSLGSTHATKTQKKTRGCSNSKKLEFNFQKLELKSICKVYTVGTGESLKSSLFSYALY